MTQTAPRTEHRLRLGLRIAVLLALAALPIACTYQGPPETLAEQRLTWSSYLAADDIRAVCAPGAPNHLRLVYNAGSPDRTRAYDLVDLPDGGALLGQRVDRGLRVNRFDVSQVLSLGAPVRAETRLSADDAARLRTALADSGVFEPPPVGLMLPTDRFFWLVTGCVDGRMLTTGFRNPSDAYGRLTFPDLLRRFDATGEAFLTPDAAVPPGTCSMENRPDGRICGALTIGADGLTAL